MKICEPPDCVLYRDMDLLQNNTENPILLLEITDNDLEQIPKLREAIAKAVNRVEFNKQVMLLFLMVKQYAIMSFLMIGHFDNTIAR